jgi:glycosyltransferase involved in cell wall biosynthesis
VQPSANPQRRRILLIASGCDATDVGESRSAFQWVSNLGLRHDVTLLTFRKRDRPSAIDQLPSVRVIEWLDLPVVGTWERFNSMLKPGYMAFYIQARRWIKRRLDTSEKFDLIHQITPLAVRYPSPAAGFRVPLVIGPVGGSLGNPDGFEAELGNTPWYMKLRMLDQWRLQHDPLLRRSYGSADCLICIAPYVAHLVRGVPVRKIEFMSDAGVDALPSDSFSVKKQDKGVFRILFVGRVIRTKGARDAVRAMAMLKDIKSLSLDVIGDGYDLPSCKEEAKRLGVDDLVTFHGRMPRQAIDSFYERSNVFLFPSFREPGGIAVLEAMSNGLAVIVADRGGPGYVVDDACGFRIAVTSPDLFARDIAAAVRTLAGSPALVEAMGRAARAKIERDFLWDAKIKKLEAIYDRVLNQEREPVSQSA